MKADPKADAAPAAGGAPKKKLLIIIIAAVLVLGGGGGAAWFFLHGKSDEAAPEKSHGKKKAQKAGPPVFVALEPFTVNLQPENGEQYLQTAITLQVEGEEQVELMKANMPKLRSRILLLLSSKKASEINTSEGKKVLADEIIEQAKQPFEHKGEAQEVADVLFTSFIIQ